MTNYENMTKAQLIELLAKANNGEGRKKQVLSCLENGVDTIEAIAQEVGITRKNVSSILTGLRKEGYTIITLKVGGQSILKMIDVGVLGQLMNPRATLE